MNILLKFVMSFSFVIFSLSVDKQAFAASPIDAQAAKSLIAGRTWVREPIKGGEPSYWSWASNGTTCLRLFEKTGKCDDTGSWKLSGDRMCYELTWWGDGFGVRSSCYRITDLGKGGYGALQDNGLISFKFTIAK